MSDKNDFVKEKNGREKENIQTSLIEKRKYEIKNKARKKNEEKKK